VSQWGIRGDTRTQQRRDGGQLLLGMADAQDVTFMHHDVLRVAAERPARCVRGREVVGADHAVAIVFQAGFAVVTMFAAVDDATDTNQIADFEIRNTRADRRYTTHNFVPRYAGKLRARPLGAHLMQVRMADAAEGDIDLNVMCGGEAAFDLQRLKGFVARMSTIGVYKHGRILDGVSSEHFPALSRL